MPLSKNDFFVELALGASSSLAPCPLLRNNICMTREEEIYNGKYEWELDYLTDEKPIGLLPKSLFILVCLGYAILTIIGVFYLRSLEINNNTLLHDIGLLLFSLGGLLLTIRLFMYGTACGIVAFWLPAIQYLFVLKDWKYFKYPFLVQAIGTVMLLF